MCMYVYTYIYIYIYIVYLSLYIYIHIYTHNPIFYVYLCFSCLEPVVATSRGSPRGARKTARTRRPARRRSGKFEAPIAFLFYFFISF